MPATPSRSRGTGATDGLRDRGVFRVRVFRGYDGSHKAERKEIRVAATDALPDGGCIYAQYTIIKDGSGVEVGIVPADVPMTSRILDHADTMLMICSDGTLNTKKEGQPSVARADLSL